MQEIALSTKPQEDKLKKIVLTLIFVVIAASAALAVGFVFGKSGQGAGFFETAPVATRSATPSGWKVLDTAEFSIYYPKDWEIKQNGTGEPPGAKIKSEGGKVELWLRLEKPYLFTEEEGKKQTAKKESTLKVDGREGKLTEFIYDTEGYYLIIEVPATKTKPLTTFWSTAGNEDYKKNILDIIGSFISKSQTNQ